MPTTGAVYGDFEGCLYACSPGSYGAADNLTTAGCTAPCPNGFYCPRGTAEPIPCPPGTYNPVPYAPVLQSCIRW